MLEEQALDPERHDRAGFSCGVSDLDEYIRRLASQHRRKGVSSVYVLVDTGTPNLILGYAKLITAIFLLFTSMRADLRSNCCHSSPRMRA